MLFDRNEQICRACCDSMVDRAVECMNVQMTLHIYVGKVPGSRVIRLHALSYVMSCYFPHSLLGGCKPISKNYPLLPSSSTDLDLHTVHECQRQSLTL